MLAVTLSLALWLPLWADLGADCCTATAFDGAAQAAYGYLPLSFEVNHGQRTKWNRHRCDDRDPNRELARTIRWAVGP